MNSRALALALCLCGVARAEPVTLRIAATAPDGTTWARELRNYGYAVQVATHGQVALKWYFGGLAGDELSVVERVRRGQLDGIAGSAVCERLAPSLRVMRLTGLLETRDEMKFLFGKLRPSIDRELAQNGFTAMGFSSFGTTILLTRTQVSSMEELRKTRLWVWTQDDVLQRAFLEMGVPVRSSELHEAARLYNDGAVDGFVTMPLGGLAYQWSAQARWFTDLPIGFLPACLVVAQRAFDPLPIDAQNEMRAAGARVAIHFDDTGRVQDEALLGGLFEKQGMKRSPVSAAFADQFYREARRVRDVLAPSVAPPELLNHVVSWLADYRAEHGTPTRR